MKYHARAFATTALLSGVAFVSSNAAAAGLGNLTYTQQELQQPIAQFNATTFVTGPGGSNTALMLRDYFIVMGSNDSGVPPGAIHVFDVKDPRHPKLLKTLSDTPETSKLRELHAMPMSMVDGKDILVMPTTEGVQFFDFTDPMNPKASGSLTLAGVNGGDYDNAAWELSWSWPYVYVGSTGNGVFVVDATDPAKPTLAATIPITKFGNFRVGPVHAAGNYLVVCGMDQGPTKIAVLDVSDPKSPFLSSSGTAPGDMYSALVLGDRIYGAGPNGIYSFVKWTPDAVTVVASKTFGKDKGGYCTYQDGFAFCGQSSEGYRKVDVRDDKNIKEVANGDIPNEPTADTDFATVLGNLVYLGNDHGTGAAFLPHTLAPDTTPPAVVKVYPGDKEVKRPRSTRVTIFFSDEIDLNTVTTSNIVFRKSDGTAVPAVFSHSSFNAISIGPKQSLEAATTYEVVIPAGGIKDLAQNPIAAATTVRFSTGDTLAPSTASDAGVTVTPDAGGNAGGGGGADGGSASGTDAAAGAGGSTGGNGGSSAGASGSGGSAAGSGGASGGSGGAGGNGGSGNAGTTTTGSGGSGGAMTTTGSGGSSTSTGNAPAASSGGCGCSIPGGARSSGFLAAWGLIGLGVAARRARRLERGQRNGRK